MQVELFSAVPGVAASRLMVVIAGANQQPADLRSAGFLTAIRDRHLDIDVALLAPRPAHLLDRSALAALHHEIMRPARSSGRVTVWLAGISWGGFLALLYAADHSQEVDGICLLSPYLGSRMITSEILGFPSLMDWSAGVPDTHDVLAEERRIWRYLAERRAYPPVIRYLGFGVEDRFVTAQRLLAGQLPPQVVDVVAGGHDETVWRTLWDRFRDRLAVAGPGW